MNGEQLDKWAVVLRGVEHCTHSRCTDPHAEVAPTLDAILTVLLKIVYDPDTTPLTCRRIEEVIKLAYEYGRTNEHLYTTVLRRK